MGEKGEKIMIDKIKWDKICGDTFEISCDDCGESEEIEGDFQDCISFLKENNWLITKEDGKWEHFCSDCKKENK